MDRFNSVIIFSVHGHVHKEDWNVQRDILDRNPLSMNFVVGSATTFQNKPPSFSVIYLEPENLLPIDFETYSFDLDLANNKEGSEPEWKVHHSFRKTYGLKDLSPGSFLKYSAKMLLDNGEAALKYRNHRSMDHKSTDNQGSCDGKCQLNHYCITTSNSYDDWEFCHRSGLSDFNLSPVLSFEQWINHDWFEATV